jgi:DNA-binding MarR family transcriptional regulator
MVEDVVTYALLTASAAFVVIAVILLAKYRQVSRQINASSDIGRELLDVLETRLTKQDERILDVMARVEVIQSRAVRERAEAALETTGVLGLPPQRAEEPIETEKSPEPTPSQESREVTSQAPASQAAPVVPPFPSPDTELLKAIEAKLERQESEMMEIKGRLGVVQDVAIQRATQPAPQTVASSRRPARSGDIKEKDLLQMLSEKPRTSVEIRERFDITREHAARLLKALFDKGLVVRNDAAKPFVYELTDAGRSQLSVS